MVDKNLKQSLKEYREAHEALKKELWIIFNPLLSFLLNHVWILYLMAGLLIGLMIAGLFGMGVVE